MYYVPSSFFIADPTVNIQIDCCSIEDLKKKDEEKDLLERVKNEIETFIFEARDKLEQRDYKKCSTEEERFKISDTLTSVSDWMYEQEDTTSRKVRNFENGTLDNNNNH